MESCDLWEINHSMLWFLLAYYVYLINIWAQFEMNWNVYSSKQFTVVRAKRWVIGAGHSHTNLIEEENETRNISRVV